MLGSFSISSKFASHLKSQDDRILPDFCFGSISKGLSRPSGLLSSRTSQSQYHVREMPFLNSSCRFYWSSPRLEAEKSKVVAKSAKKLTSAKKVKSSLKSTKSVASREKKKKLMIQRANVVGGQGTLTENEALNYLSAEQKRELENESDWVMEGGEDEQSISQWEDELDGNWQLEDEIDESAYEGLKSTNDDDLLLESEIEQAKNKLRHERTQHHKHENKLKIMEKRRLREQMLKEQSELILGTNANNKLSGASSSSSRGASSSSLGSSSSSDDIGLVGKAKKTVKVDDSSEELMSGGAAIEEQRRRILQETLSRSKKSSKDGQASSSGLKETEKGKKKSKKSAEELYPENVMWPDRPVNVDIEFPTLKGVNDPSLKGLWIQELDKPHSPPPEAIAAGILAHSDEHHHHHHDRRSSHLSRENHEESSKKSLEEMSSTSGLSVRERKRMKREENWPEWTKSPVALENLALHKLISGSEHKPSSHPDQSTLHPSVTFQSLGIGEGLVKAMKSMWEISTPTEIQQLTIPQFLHGTSLLIADQTGTGKTLCYLLPMMERLLSMEQKTQYFKRRGQRCRALILLPNRELVSQTSKILSSLIFNDNRFEHWKTYSMAGGVETIKKERAKLNDGVDVLISTPDRVLLHAEYEHLFLDDTMIVIFDEADTLMSSPKSNEATNNFMEVIRDVISKQKLTQMKQVQFISASATVSPNLMEFLQKEFGNTMTSVVGSQIHKSAQTLKQDFLFGAHGDFKKRLLFHTLRKHPGKRTIIFCNTQASVKGVCTILNKAGYPALAMTSDMPPKIRQRNFKSFADGNSQILVATDLASRGLDLGSSVNHVILYDFPTNTIDYLHRIGRTARAGADGLVTGFLSPKDQGLAATIKDSLLQGKSLASIRPSKPDIKTIRAFERKVPKRQPKHIRHIEVEESL